MRYRTLSVSIETAKEQFGFDDGFTERAGETSSITATGNLSIYAVNDVTVTGGDLRSGEHTSIFAGGNIDFNALDISKTFKSSSYSESETKKQVSSVTSGSGITIASVVLDENGNAIGGGSVSSEGTNFSAQGLVNIYAAGDVTLETAVETSYSSTTSSSSGLFSSSSTTREVFELTNTTNSITGSEVSITAGGRLFDRASSVTSTQGGVSYAGGELVFGAASDIKAENSSTSSETLFGLFSKGSTTQTLTSTAVTSQVTSANGISLTSAGNLTLTGGLFDAGEGEITRNLGGQTFLKGAVSTTYSNTTNHNNNGILITDTSQIDLNQTAEFTQMKGADNKVFDQSDVVTISLDQSQVALGQSLTQKFTDQDNNQRTDLIDFFLNPATGPPEEGEETTAETAQETTSNSKSPYDQSKVNVGIPSSANGAGYAYLDDLIDTENVTVEDMELVHNYHYFDEQKSLGAISQLVIAIAAPQNSILSWSFWLSVCALSV